MSRQPPREQEPSYPHEVFHVVLCPAYTRCLVRRDEHPRRVEGERGGHEGVWASSSLGTFGNLADSFWVA